MDKPFADVYQKLALWVPENKYPPTPHNLVGSRLVSHAERKSLQDNGSWRGESSATPPSDNGAYVTVTMLLLASALAGAFAYLATGVVL